MTSLADFAPEYGIVLGSGLDALESCLQVEGTLAYSDIPDLPAPLVPGHTGAFVWGRIGAQKAVLARGRVHLYEGHPAHAVTAGVRYLANCGVRRLILTNAAGTLNPAHPPDSWMSIVDQLNMTGTSPLLGGPNFCDMSEIYSSTWRAHFARAAAAEGVPLHEGVYAGLPGPQYETPAEIRMLRVLGADAVGMSTVLEAIQARALGLEVAGFSCLTNWAAGISGAPLSHAEVLATGRHAAAMLVRILRRGLGAQ